jgi:hypothetical protein
VFFRQLSKRVSDAKCSATESKLEADDELGETIADYLAACIARDPRPCYTLKEINQMISKDAEWFDWWEYNKDIWKSLGWTEEDIILAKDVGEIFTNKRHSIDPAKYRRVTNFHLENTKKVGADNSFLPFKGRSVVGMLALSDSWADFYQQLLKTPEILDYFALLPMDSWHITIANISESTLETTRIFKEFAKVDWSCSFRIKQIYTQGVLLLTVEFDEVACKALLATCAFLGIKHLMPPQFHLSLGYQNRPFPIKTSRALEEKISKTLDHLNLKNTGQRICSPNVYLFENMAKFVLYDGADSLKPERAARFRSPNAGSR